MKHTLEELVICILVQPHVVQWTRPVYYKTIRNNQKFRKKYTLYKWGKISLIILGLVHQNMQRK